MTITAPQKRDLFPNGNPTPEQRAEVLAAHERLKDRHPEDVSVEDLASIGHERRNLLAVIRENCVHCQGGNAAEVRRCQCTGCPFWPYRTGCNPFRAPPTEAQVEHGRRMASSRRAALTA